MYPFPGWIRHDQFLWCCMIWVIWNHWSSFGSSQWDAPLERGHLTKSADRIFLSQANHHETTMLIISVSWSQYLCVRHSYLCILFSLGILLSWTHLEYKTLWDWPVKMNRHSGRVGFFSRPPTHPSLSSLSLSHFLLSDVGGATNNCYFEVFLFVMAKTHVDRVWDRVRKQFELLVNETILSWEASLRFLMFTYQYFVPEVPPWLT